MLGGSIATLGSRYVITLKAANATSGDTLVEELVEADSKEQVLSALGKAGRELRGKLGESLSSLQKFDVPLQEATTYQHSASGRSRNETDIVRIRTVESQMRALPG